VLLELREAMYPVAQRSTVPLKIENDRPIGLRRDVPGDQLLIVCRRELYLLGLRQAGGGGRDPGEIGPTSATSGRDTSPRQSRHRRRLSHDDIFK
jgi:hypothetical protein